MPINLHVTPYNYTLVELIYDDFITFIILRILGEVYEVPK